jgi:outer membrane protein OmpA-like peptidoglycan-associated protein
VLLRDECIEHLPTYAQDANRPFTQPGAVSRSQSFSVVAMSKAKSGGLSTWRSRGLPPMVATELTGHDRRRVRLAQASAALALLTLGGAAAAIVSLDLDPHRSLVSAALASGSQSVTEIAALIQRSNSTPAPSPTQASNPTTAASTEPTIVAAPEQTIVLTAEPAVSLPAAEAVAIAKTRTPGTAALERASALRQTNQQQAVAAALPPEPVPASVSVQARTPELVTPIQVTATRAPLPTLVALTAPKSTDTPTPVIPGSTELQSAPANTALPAWASVVAPSEVTETLAWTNATGSAKPDCLTELAPAVRQTVIWFDVGQAAISATQATLIKRLSGVLETCPQAQIEVSGHTDIAGADNLNYALSWRRAEAVMAALAAEGTDPARLVVVGYGPREPIETADTMPGKQANALNRRVELRLR